MTGETSLARARMLAVLSDHTAGQEWRRAAEAELDRLAALDALARAERLAAEAAAGLPWPEPTPYAHPAALAVARRAQLRPHQLGRRPPCLAPGARDRQLRRP